ncbi:MAG: hypothetical protein WA874_01025 [Chryseosolibacter sp.]
MKKVVSICLVALLLLNVMGYYGVFLGLRYRNTQEFIQRLDAEAYNNSETLTLKIPLSIPYYGETEFVRVDGEIEHAGEFFRLVKQKYEKDTLHIVCIRDTRRQNIQNALKDYVETFATHSTDPTQVKSVPSFIKDYVSATFKLDASASGWCLMLTHPAAKEFNQDPYLSATVPPPRG